MATVTINASKATQGKNKGLQIRKNKLKKKAQKRTTVKPSQENLVRFVTFEEKVIERINGKYRHPTTTRTGRGLQIENKVYLENGQHKLVNRTTFKIKKIYDDIPQWATEHLIFLYQKEKSKRAPKENTPKE